MVGVTSTMARFGHVPGCDQGGLYGHGRVAFPIVHLTEMDVSNGALW